MCFAQDTPKFKSNSCVISYDFILNKNKAQSNIVNIQQKILINHLI